MGDQDYKAMRFTPDGIEITVGTMAPDATIDFIAEPSCIKGRLRASQHYRFHHGKVTIVDLQDRKEIELTGEQASLLLDDLLACFVKPTLPARWWDRVKFMFKLAQYWQGGR